jgi:hypothetical protein
MHIGLHVKYPLLLSDFIKKLDFFDGFSKNTPIPNFMKIRPVGAELFHADGQTDMMKPAIAFRDFANAPENQITIYGCSILRSQTTVYYAFEIKMKYVLR